MIKIILNGALNMMLALSILLFYGYAVSPISTLILLIKVYWFIT